MNDIRLTPPKNERKKTRLYTEYELVRAYIQGFRHALFITDHTEEDVRKKEVLAQIQAMEKLKEELLGKEK